VSSPIQPVASIPFWLDAGEGVLKTLALAVRELLRELVQEGLPGRVAAAGEGPLDRGDVVAGSDGFFPRLEASGG
jgi:hypothetical protein